MPYIKCCQIKSHGATISFQVDGAGDDDELEFEEEGEISDDPKSMAMTSSAFNESLSDSINLFQVSKFQKNCEFL